MVFSSRGRISGECWQTREWTDHSSLGCGVRVWGRPEGIKGIQSVKESLSVTFCCTTTSKFSNLKQTLFLMLLRVPWVVVLVWVRSSGAGWLEMSSLTLWRLTHCQSAGALEMSWSSKMAWVRSQGDGPKNNKWASLNDKYFSNLLCHVANIPLSRASAMAKTRLIVGGNWLPMAWKQGRELWWPFCKQPTTT